MSPGPTVLRDLSHIPKGPLGPNGAESMRALRLLACVALGASIGVVPGTAAASTTSGPISLYRQWRIVYHVNLKARNFWWSGALVAPGKNQAWAVGGVGGSGDFLEHWGGYRWRMMAVPGVNFHPDSIAASASDNVWLFADANRAFIWNGQHWAPAPGTRGMSMTNPVVLGPSDVWSIGSDVACGHGVLNHWTGAHWSVVATPGPVSAISGSSPRNFWVLTLPETSSCKLLPGTPFSAYRWNGKSFSRVRIPRMMPGHYLYPGFFTVASGNDIWIANWPKDVIVHWNGRLWQNISLRTSGTYISPTSITPDGRGGAWIGGCWHWLNGVWHPIDYFRSSCDETFGLSRIPGTMSAWRLSVNSFGGRAEGTIEINGPLP